MNKKILYLMLGVLLILSACGDRGAKTTDSEPGIPPASTDAEGGQDASSQHQDVKEEAGIITDRLRFGDEMISGEVIKNKLTKTAEVKAVWKFNDTEEYTELMGKRVANAPFLINLGCSLYASIFLNETAIKENELFGEVLEGYKVTGMKVDFLDYEDNSRIAGCTATGPEWEDISFKAYREYGASMFGSKIGERLG